MNTVGMRGLKTMLLGLMIMLGGIAFGLAWSPTMDVPPLLVVLIGLAFGIGGFFRHD